MTTETDGKIASADAPWRRALEALHDPYEEVFGGAWPWRKFRIGDTPGSKNSFPQLLETQNALALSGKEFSVYVWRPMSVDRRTPANYRLALVCWDEFLDMGQEEVFEKMHALYGGGLGEGAGR